jgi:HSP20 family protein
VDVAETDSAYEIKAELPGMEQSDIEVKVSDDVLTIQGGERRKRREEEGLLLFGAALRLVPAVVPCA